jgi:hypothetical protein
MTCPHRFHSSKDPKHGQWTSFRWHMNKCRTESMKQVLKQAN